MSWPSVALGDVTKFARKSVAPQEIESGTNYVGLENIQSSGEFLSVGAVESGELASSKFAFTSDHILFGKLRPYLSKTARPEFSGICSTDILPIAATPRVDKDFLFHALRFPKFVDDVSSLATGVNLPRISPSVLAEMRILLPPLSEQLRIAAILDKADSLRSKRRKAMAKLDQLLQSVFLEMFGSATESTHLVSDLADPQSGVRTGPFGSQLLHSEFVDSGIAVLGIDNAVSNSFRWGERRFITQDKFDALKRYRVAPGDVLITIMGTCGRCAVVPDDIPIAINTKHLCCITLDRAKAEPEFLHSYFLTHPIARSYLAENATGAIMAGLNMGIIKNMPVSLPPLEKQRAFVQRKKAIRTLRGLQRSALDKETDLFAALQHRAFA
ncbi:MAG: restriction endonuclease subunit S [Gemmatimonadaceae bacterium]